MQTLSSDIFTLSHCLDHERMTRQKIMSVLTDLGFDCVWPAQATDANCRLIRGSQQVYLCLVDSVTMIVPKTLDDLSHNDILITDNGFIESPRCGVYQLPHSWLGIYAHDPKIYCHEPDRSFSLAINRSSTARLWVFISMLGQSLTGYMNYNGQSNDRSHNGSIQIDRDWNDIVLARECLEALYQELCDQGRWPYSNHDLNHDRALQSGLVNMVMETYYQSRTITHSEKIFRALLLPRPWTVYGNQHLVRRLTQLGFDVMSDLVPHDRYDGLAHSYRKLQVYRDVSIETIQSLQWKHISDRCESAARHNRARLAQWQATWQDDLDRWLERLQQDLA